MAGNGDRAETWTSELREQHPRSPGPVSCDPLPTLCASLPEPMPTDRTARSSRDGQRKGGVGRPPTINLAGPPVMSARCCSSLRPQGALSGGLASPHTSTCRSTTAQQMTSRRDVVIKTDVAGLHLRPPTSTSPPPRSSRQRVAPRWHSPGCGALSAGYDSSYRLPAVLACCDHALPSRTCASRSNASLHLRVWRCAGHHRKVRERLNSTGLEGILAPMYDSLTTHCRCAAGRGAFGDKVYRRSHQTSRFPESTVAGAHPTMDPASPGRALPSLPR